MKYGFEKEFFVLDANDLTTPLMVNTKIFSNNYDASGVLVECRSKPFDNIIDAVYSLKADEYRVNRLANEHGLILSDLPYMEVSKKIKLQVQRRFEKGIVEFQNLYGFEEHRNGKFHTAGLHISFTNPQTIYVKDNVQTYNALFDYVQLFRYLDKYFKEEIKNSKRNPGFYEIKSDGRIEYRSLPANIDLNKVIDCIESYNMKEEEEE